jgi:hypothetical protein
MFWKRRRSDRDYREEIQSHIDIETERLVAEGFSRRRREMRHAGLSVTSQHAMNAFTNRSVHRSGWTILRATFGTHSELWGGLLRLPPSRC